MRLTLRTMLAYLDDILEPVDAEELGQKIEESKFASDLVHRIRNSTRRLRLGAPKLEGKGMGLDPNTVAEYLDNTLPTEHVPDFEKVCLESDVHLAEVASCHQILTLVLGEPADVEHAVRERIYRLSGEQQSLAAEPLGPLAPLDETALSDAMEFGDAGAKVTRSEQAATPDYLQSGSRVPLKSLAITLVLAFLLGVVALRAMGSFDSQHPLWRLMFGSGEGRVAEVPEAKVEQDGAAAASPAVPPARTEAEQSEPAAPGSASSSTPELDQPSPSQGGAAESDESTVPSEAVDLAGSAPAGVAGPSAEDPGVASPPVEDGAPQSVVAEDPPDSAEQPALVAVGRYISEAQILARYDTEQDAWFSLQPDASLVAGDQLLVFPTYRPQILLANPGIKITFSGESRVQLAAPGREGAPQMLMQYGRATAVPVADGGASLVLDLGGRQAAVLFGDMNSAMAIEVRRYLPPGADPERTAPETVVVVYATSGQIGWQEGDTTVTLNAGRLLAMLGTQPIETRDAAMLPDWIEGNQLAYIYRHASQELGEYLGSDRSLGLALMERTEFRKQEVRSLACRALTVLDIYDPILKSLDDESQRSHWPHHFDTLRFSVSRSAQSAVRLREMAEKLYGDRAAEIYRLCWGYSPEQLQGDSAAQLVENLASETMCIRVLAKWNLERITGMTLTYSAWLTPDQERTKVARWRQTLADGRIVYRSPPLPIPELMVSERATEDTPP